MPKFLKKLRDVRENDTIRQKIIFTLAMLAVYRLLVLIPVPFVDISALMERLSWAWADNSSWIGYFLMLLGWSLEQFSIIAVWLSPFINASIIMQLMSSVIPHLEELTEQWEAGQQKIQQYTRYITFPLAFLQWIGMVYFINYMLGWNVIDTSIANVLLTAIAMWVWSILLMWIWELITEKWISNWISILIFSSIVSWIVKQIYWSVSWSTNILWIIVFMLVIVIWLIILSIFILKSVKEIPVVYARTWKVEQTSTLPIPLNPVGMVPIIFSIAFVTFPYLISKMMVQFQPGNVKIASIATWIESNMNIYSQQPWPLAILFYFILIVVFTFFYTLIVFSPEKMSDNIQKRGWFIPWIRPGKETSKYINWILMHLCLRGWMWLALIGIYSYILNYIPFISDIIVSLWSLPVVVTWSWVIIMVWVVQDIINKVKTELLMQRYEKI